MIAVLYSVPVCDVEAVCEEDGHLLLGPACSLTVFQEALSQEGHAVGVEVRVVVPVGTSVGAASAALSTPLNVVSREMILGGIA